jgi:hypothetical protein
MLAHYKGTQQLTNYSVQVNMETNEYYKAQQNNRNKKSERDMWTTIKKGTTTNQLL